MSSIPSDIMKSTKQKQNKLRSQVWWQPQHFGRGGKRVQNLRPFSQPHNSVLARVIQDPVSKPETTTKHYRRADGSLFLGDSKRSCLEWHMLACGCPGRKSVINWCRRHQGFTCDKAGKTSLRKSGEFVSVASAASAKAWKTAASWEEREMKCRCWKAASLAIRVCSGAWAVPLTDNQMCLLFP